MAQFTEQTTNVTAVPNGSTSGVALAANPARVFYKIQNTSTNPLYVLYGSGTASASNCHEILKACTTGSDGIGGIINSSEVVYTGIIAVGGTAPAFTAYELAP